MSNGTLVFLFVAAAAYAALSKTLLPDEVADVLSSISAYFKPYTSAEERQLNNLVASAAQHHLNRTVADPLFLSIEMGRNCMSAQQARAVMRLYKNRCSINPALQLGDHVEKATVLFMTPQKVAPASIDLIRGVIRDYTWASAPFDAAMFLVNSFPLGAVLSDTLHDVWRSMCTQTACGQYLALDIQKATFVDKNMKLSKDNFAILLQACGLWVTLKERLLPSLFLSSALQDQLSGDFRDMPSFQDDVAKLCLLEPPDDCKEIGDVLKWTMQHLPRVREVRDADAEEKKRTAQSFSPDYILAAKEVQSVSCANLLSAMVLDANAYKSVLKKIDSDNQGAEKAWQEQKTASGVNTSSGVGPF